MATNPFDLLGLFQPRQTTPVPASSSLPPVSIDFGEKMDRVIAMQQDMNALLTAILDQIAQQQFPGTALPAEGTQIEANSLAYLRYPKILFESEADKYYKIATMYLNEIGPIVVGPLGIFSVTIPSLSIITTAIAKIRWFCWTAPAGPASIEYLVDGVSALSFRDSTTWVPANGQLQLLMGERVIDYLELGSVSPIRAGTFTNQTFTIRNNSAFPLRIGATVDLLKIDEIPPEEVQQYRKL